MIRITETAVIDQPIEAVWRVLRDFNSHWRWHPAIAASRIEADGVPDQVGAVREFSLQDGGRLREQLIRLDDRHHSLTYCLLEAPLPLYGYVATIELKPVTDDGRTFWRWQCRFDAPPERATELAELVANDIYRAGMRGLAAYLRRGPGSTRGPSGSAPIDPAAEPPAVERRHSSRTPDWRPAAPDAAAPASGATRARAIVIGRYGPPDVLDLADVDVPPPGPGEVQIRQSFVGVNFIDIYCRTGYFDLVRPPGILGMEAAGTISAVGSGVTHLTLGDRVAYACAPPGSYTSLRTMAADLVVRLPDVLPDDIAAAGLLKGATAGFLIHDVHAVRPGDQLIVHAGAGGVGSLLVQWAHAIGAKVISTVSTHDKAGRVRALGADHVIVGRDDRFVDTVMELTGGRGADVIYDAIGRDSFDFSLKALAIRGHLVSFGQASGPIGARDIGALASRSVTLSRPNYGHYTGTRAEIERQADRLFAALRTGLLAIEPPAVYPFAEAARAHADLESGRTTGSLVLQV